FVDGELHRGYLLDFAWHLFLPVICLTYAGFAYLTKVMRGSVLETISADFVRTARAKGVSEQHILFRHVLRNSLLPLITMAAAILPSLFVGSFVVEYIFSIQGMGLLTIDAAKNADINIVMATTLVGSVLSLLSLLLRDILYAAADPRVTYD
ncbi:MAG: ABC transporter permease, partial [Phycisphaeraceae bacterium]